jgi:Uncharacterised nucleotidyltransferase
VAPTPGWRSGMSDAARWVTARGLRTNLAPPPAPLEPSAWRRLVDECARHRLDGLLVAAVASHALVVEADQCAEVAAIEVALTRVRMAYEPRLVDVLIALQSAGIDARVLKGSALGHLDYPDPQMRPTGDIDVLVRGEQIDAAIGLSMRDGATRVDPDPVAGYAAAVGKGATLVLSDGAELDLHRILVWGPLGVRLPPAELWATERSFAVEGHVLHTLGLEETLLHVACHLMVGGQPRGILVRDVAQLIVAPGLDPERATGLARRCGAEAVLATSVRLAVAELGLIGGGPLEGWAAGHSPRWRDRAWMRVGRPGAALPAIEPLATWLELPPPQRRVLVRATLHPAPGTWPGPGQRVERVARRALRALSGTT